MIYKGWIIMCDKCQGLTTYRSVLPGAHQEALEAAKAQGWRVDDKWAVRCPECQKEQEAG